MGNANNENSLVKNCCSSNHKRERRKLTSEQHCIAISKPQSGFLFNLKMFIKVVKV